MNPRLVDRFPGGCFIGFNHAIDRGAAEAFAATVGNVVNEGFQKLTLILNSPGGNTDQARYLYSVLEALPVEIITFNVSRIMSAANLIFLTGDKRYSTPRSSFFFHETTSEFKGEITKRFAKERLHGLQVEDDRSAEIIAQKTGKPLETVRRWMTKEMTLEGEDAVKAGIINGESELVIPEGAFVHQVTLPPSR